MNCLRGVNKAGLHREIYFPLMALIDFRGFRLIAISLLPINSNSLIYGTADGGKTVKQSDKTFNAHVRRLAEQIHSQPHRIGNANEHQLAVDIEAHKGTDNKYYMLDFARAFAPEEPDVARLSDRTCSSWFRMLRPELSDRFFAETGKCLSHDALSKWDNNVIHLRNLKHATRLLHHTVLPEVTSVLEAKNMYQYIVLHGTTDLTEEVHKRGVNMRHIGRIRALATSPDVKKLLLSEMAARVLKNELNQRLRKQVELLKVPLSQPYRATALAFLREFLCTSGKAESEATTHFWSVKIKPWLVDSFPTGLSVDELQPTYDLRASLNPMYMIKRFEKLTASMSRNNDSARVREREGA
jgi:hypothetical protein